MLELTLINSSTFGWRGTTFFKGKPQFVAEDYYNSLLDTEVNISYLFRIRRV